MQLSDELEATREMVKADWECWKKLDKRFERIHGPLLSDSDEDDHDEACRDKRKRQKWNVELSQHAQEMDMLPYSLSLPPIAWVSGSGTKSSAQRKWRKTRSKKAGTFISCAVGNGEKIIEEEAKNVCARPHSGIRLSVIDKVDNDSMEGDDDNKRNKTDNETANGDKEMSIGGSGFFLHSPGYNCECGIVLNIHNNNIHEGVNSGYRGSRQITTLEEYYGHDERTNKNKDEYKQRAKKNGGTTHVATNIQSNVNPRIPERDPEESSNGNGYRSHRHKWLTAKERHACH